MSVAASTLLEEILDAQGGLDAFRSAKTARAHLHCAGWAFTLKGRRGALSDFTGTVSTEEPRAVLEPYAGGRGIFSPDRVSIEDLSGQTVATRAHPRAAFGGLRRQLRWDELDLLYFAGYALWGYLNAPFMFTRPGFEMRQASSWSEQGEEWRALEVDFPNDIPAHSKTQRFYFDSEGLLRRNDYTADVFGGWAKAAHYCWDHRKFDGIVVPTSRRAVPRTRSEKPRKRITIVSIAIDTVELE